MIFFFTGIDYAAFALWILISIVLSYFFVQKLNFFGGGRKTQKILTIGLLVGFIFMYYIFRSGSFVKNKNP